MNWLIDSGILNFSGRTLVFCEAYTLDIFTGTPFIKVEGDYKRKLHIIFCTVMVFFPLPLEARLFVLSHSLIIALDMVMFILSEIQVGMFYCACHITY